MSEAPYKKLLTYRFSVIIYDYTVLFSKRFVLVSSSNLGKPDYRTADQMNQAARSQKQCIAEGSDALKTSFKMGIKLTNVAKSSGEELLNDYEDFLRQNTLAIWDKNDPRVLEIRRKSAALIGNLSYLSDFAKELPLPNTPEEAANLMLTLCHQITFLLNRQVEALEKKHLTEGGYTEKLYNKRKAFLKKTFLSNLSILRNL